MDIEAPYQSLKIILSVGVRFENNIKLVYLYI